MLSVIVPVLNEARQLPDALGALRPLIQAGTEILIVDGGSQDDSVAITQAAGFRVIVAERGRARQMNAGAVLATGDVLLFLHADTRLPAHADVTIASALADKRSVWGRFDVRIIGRPLMLRIVSRLMNLRSRMTGIATGDQAIFVTRAAFNTVGGFPEQPLMEDIELSSRLLAVSRPACLSACVTTSGRRWETNGVWRTILLMWRLRWNYWRGVPARELAEAYR
ncbi:MAG: TIGR04283 family arsenosugar biosynthesis glycosyltransferase [Betaproteobacteria bacterium]|jgi:rSAM/selenodomain-associated transferase 2